jgi:hypothetical protein
MILYRAYLIEPKVSTVNFVSWFCSLACGKGACTLFLHAVLEEIACPHLVFPGSPKQRMRDH